MRCSQGLLAAADGWISLSALAERTDATKSTVTRHVKQLAAQSVVETRSVGREKEVRVSFTGELLAR